MESSSIIVVLISMVLLFLVIYLILENKKNSDKLNVLNEKHNQFLESIEKYVEIFNEQNVKELLLGKNIDGEEIANEKIRLIKNEYRDKLLSQTKTLTEEQEMLIDFVTLTLSLLIKTPPNLRAKLIHENTDNEIIKKILSSKLSSIEKHYIPVSLLEVAISKENE